MKITKKSTILIYFFIILLIAYFLKIYRFSKTEIVQNTKSYSFKDQWINIKNNSSINENAKVYTYWLDYDNSNFNSYPQVTFITQNKFGRFQYIDAIHENDKIKLEFNGTGKNLKDNIDNCISTDEFADKIDLVYNNRHKLFKAPGYKYRISSGANYSSFIAERSDAYSVGKNGILTKIPEKDFPLKNVIYMHCEKLDEKNNTLEDICLIFK